MPSPINLSGQQCEALRVLNRTLRGINTTPSLDTSSELAATIRTFFDLLMSPDLGGQLAITTTMIMLTSLSTILEDDMFRPLNDKVVATLYNTMEYPPKNMAGIDWRSADGTDKLGSAGMPYARSVPRNTPQMASPPDPSVVFEQLMQRRRSPEGVEYAPLNPDGLSSLTFAFGTLVIHSIFNTDRSHPLGKHIPVNNTSSYFDLAPLYGDNQAEQDLVRNSTLGRGLLFVDCFSDDRVVQLPPAAAALLVVFNRNHNYIANALLKSEPERWSDPPPKNCTLKAKQDEELFQTARLINCFHFVNIVITDYVGGVMGVPKNGGGWPGNAEPFDVIPLPNNPGPAAGRGEGNLLSIEFNTLYRWHATLSQEDVKWIEETRSAPPPKVDHPKHRTFAGLKRGKDGAFNDSDLAKIIHDATESSAGFFRAQGTPEILKEVDIAGIKQARQWSMCTLNEFRDYLGHPPHKSFLEWNANPEIASAAEKLYHHIDNLELYPGLHAEGNAGDGFPESRSYHPLRPSTMRSGLLFDAIALLRGDRFLTSGRTVQNLTSWGLDDIQRQYPSKAFGGHIHKLFFRLLPDHFPRNSIYSWFPMCVPSFMETLATLPADPSNPWNFQRPADA